MINEPKTLAEWGASYRKFVKRQTFLERWPFASDTERLEAWREWKLWGIYNVAE